MTSTEMTKGGVRRLAWRWKGWGFSYWECPCFNADSLINHHVQFGPFMIWWEYHYGIY